MLTSPISGVVAAVGVAVGDRVSAGSSSSVITVIGKNQFEVTTTVALSDIDLVKVGQTAQVTVNGLTAPVSGKVSMIGILNTSTDSSTASFPVTVALAPASGTTLFDGTGAAVAVSVSNVEKVLTVPTSAVRATSGGYAVTVIRDGVNTDVQVERLDTNDSHADHQRTAGG